MRPIIRRGVLLLAFLPFASCDSVEPTDPVPPELLDVMRHWRFSRAEVGNPDWLDGEWEHQLGGVVSDRRDWGEMMLYPSGTGPNAITEVYSNETGHTYWAYAQAPYTLLSDTGSVYGTGTELNHFLWFHKDSDDATLEFVVSGVLLETIDDNPIQPTELECPGLMQDPSDPDCLWLIQAEAYFQLAVYGEPSGDLAICSRDVNPPCVFSIGGFAALNGRRGVWEHDVSARTMTLERLWDDSDFVWDPDVGNESSGAGGRAQLRLREPLRIRIPLDLIETGTEFRVETTVWVSAINHLQRESYVSAYLRDPVVADGLTVEYTGLTPVEGPVPPLGGTPLDPPPVCGYEAPQGAMEFADTRFTTNERARDARVEVIRHGGNAGRVAALLTSRSGSAIAGSDFREVSSYVLFEDGEEGSRTAIIPLVGDLEPEEVETLELSLTVGEGCATLGQNATATLTIIDDDWPPTPDRTYTIGGTVSGLIGAGLVLTVNSTDDLEVENGPFVFGREFPDKLPYNVGVGRQPTGPAQSCAVVNGSGVIAGADVMDVEVTCGPPIGSSGLDPSFGDGGKVYSGLSGGATAMAVQPDGKIVLVGGQRIARYNPDGTPDASFGVNGETIADVYGSSDRLEAVAVQPDGGIVVAGDTKVNANSPTQEDWLIVRFAPDGTRDLTFGADGQVILDFDGRGDGAQEILVAPDGSIIVTGTASNATTGISDADFAAVKLNPDGTLDGAFGNGGRRLVDLAGRTDLGYSSTLQADGKIVLAGRVADSGGEDPDIGVVRLNPDGSLDSTFGEGGTLRPETDTWDEAADVVVQPDGRILVVGLSGSLLLARYLPDGSVDSSFGGSGQVSIPRITAGRAVALRPDGSIVAVGFHNGDFAIALLAPDGTLDAHFGTDGVLYVDFFGETDTPVAVEVLPEGAILVAGYSTSGGLRSAGLAKVLP